MFEAFGISRLAESAYRVLLANPGLDLDGVGTRLSGDAGGAVAELIDRGLVTRSESVNRHFRIETPERAMDLLIAQEEAALEARRIALSDLRDGVADLVADFIGGRSRVLSGLIEEIDGGDAVRSRLYQMAGRARREVWTVNPGPAPAPRALDASRAMDTLARDRGVRARSIFSTEVLIDGPMRGYLSEVIDAGDEVRVHPDPPVLLFVVDREIAVVPTETAAHGSGALVLHSPSLVEPLVVLYRSLWQASLPFDPSGEPIEADEQRLRRIVGMLADGQKDEAIARRLGLSVRTVRRLISVAIGRLAAESRFQAGAQAVRREWVPSADWIG